MECAKASALEWAVALMRAPENRNALRKRPLPSGVDALLATAAGVNLDALAQAARAYGEPEWWLRDAARFYAREVLFFPGADAYRILGVPRDASSEQIKAHHRLLQQWLHPDRARGDDDSVFATRVNTAWNRLRGDSARAAYDASLEGELEGHVERTSPPWLAVGIEARDLQRDWRRRVPVIALGAACFGLGALAIRDAARQPVVQEQRARVSPTLAAMLWDMPMRPAREDHAVGPRMRTLSAPPPPAPAVAFGRIASSPGGAPRSVRARPEPTPDVPDAGAGRAIVPESAISERSGGGLDHPIPGDPGNAEEHVGHDDLPSMERVSDAYRAGAMALDHLIATQGDRTSAVDEASGQHAEHLRREVPQQPEMKMGTPRWRIGTTRARMTVTGTGPGDVPVIAKVAFVWEDGRWVVTDMGLERVR